MSEASDGSIEGKPMRDTVIWNRQQIKGNGGKGLLSRMDDTESDNTKLKNGKVDNSSHEKQRDEDLIHSSKEFLLVRGDIKQLREDIKSDKRLTVAAIGVGLSALFSAASLIVALGGFG